MKKLPLVFATLKLYWISLSLDLRGNFSVLSVVILNKSKGKSKSNSEFAALIELHARFARSSSRFLHLIYPFLGSTTEKSGFSEGLNANFGDVARRHSLGYGVLVVCWGCVICFCLRLEGLFCFLGTDLYLSLKWSLYGENRAFKYDIFLLA